MKVKGYIAVMLLVCFSAFLGHNLVPHHHHSEVYNSPIAAHCPFEHGDQHDHDSDSDASEHPTHCHAFNDVVFEKYNSLYNRAWSGQVQSIIVPSQTLVPEALFPLLSGQFVSLKLPCSSHTAFGTRALRAPPAVA